MPLKKGRGHSTFHSFQFCHPNDPFNCEFVISRVVGGWSSRWCREKKKGGCDGDGFDG